MVYWVIGATLVFLVGAMIADLRSIRPATGQTIRKDSGAMSAVVTPSALPADAASRLGELSGLGAQGWALGGPTGTLLATNEPAGAALLADALTMLRPGPEAGKRLWDALTLEGPVGVILGSSTDHGWSLAVLARGDADRPRLRTAMADILGGIRDRGPGWEQADAARMLGAAQPMEGEAPISAEAASPTGGDAETPTG